MPILQSRPARPIVACAVAFLFVSPTAAGAKTVGAELRVVGPSGQTLAQLTQYTGGVMVKTDPGSECFGSGTGGSGEKRKMRGKTALGIVQDALASARDLRPLSVTDAFDFGLGVCGIGGFEAQGTQSWYLKRNHVGAQVGGDQLKLKRGDQVLWYLAPSFPYPPELSLEAPRRVAPGGDVPVQVYEYADDGTRTPAAGATVAGGDADASTDARGAASVPTSGSGNVALRATRGAEIPSNEAVVCVAEKASECSPQALIAGTGKRDKIKGTKRPEKIKARGRNDKVKARGGGPDRISCGSGKRDVAVVGSNDTVRACEKVRRK